MVKTSTTMDPPGTSSADTSIGLLQDAVIALRRHPRDPDCVLVANRIHGFLARFPTHFIVEFLERKADGDVVLHRVGPSDWPDWSLPMVKALDLPPEPPA